MSRAAGTGSPQFFLCPVLRRQWPRTSAHHRLHRTIPTGRHKAGGRSVNGGMRRVARALEFECSCGHVGWSTHIELAKEAVRLELVKAEDITWENDVGRLNRMAGMQV